MCLQEHHQVHKKGDVAASTVTAHVLQASHKGTCRQDSIQPYWT